MCKRFRYWAVLCVPFLLLCAAGCGQPELRIAAQKCYAADMVFIEFAKKAVAVGKEGWAKNFEKEEKLIDSNWAAWLAANGYKEGDKTAEIGMLLVLENAQKRDDQMRRLYDAKEQVAMTYQKIDEALAEYEALKPVQFKSFDDYLKAADEAEGVIKAGLTAIGGIAAGYFGPGLIN